MKTLLLVLNLLLASTSSLPIAGALLEAVEEPNNSIELIDRDRNIQNENQSISIEFELENIDDKGGISKQFIDQDNVINTVTVEANGETNNSFNNIMSLQNKTYTITYTKDSSVRSSFKIDIFSNKIQRVHSNKVTLYKGTLSNSRLVRVSSTKAQQIFNQKIFFVTINYNISATIIDGKIVVTASP